MFSIFILPGKASPRSLFHNWLCRIIRICLRWIAAQIFLFYPQKCVRLSVLPMLRWFIGPVVIMLQHQTSSVKRDASEQTSWSREISVIAAWTAGFYWWRYYRPLVFTFAPQGWQLCNLLGWSDLENHQNCAKTHTQILRLTWSTGFSGLQPNSPRLWKSETCHISDDWQTRLEGQMKLRLWNPAWFYTTAQIQWYSHGMTSTLDIWVTLYKRCNAQTVGYLKDFLVWEPRKSSDGDRWALGEVLSSFIPHLTVPRIQTIWRSEQSKYLKYCIELNSFGVKWEMLPNCYLNVTFDSDAICEEITMRRTVRSDTRYTHSRCLKQLPMTASSILST